MNRAAAETRGWSPVALAAAAAAVAVLVVIAVVGAVSARRYEAFLGGYWVGDPGFLERARLKDMQLFIAPERAGRRQGYLLMTDLAGGFLANQTVEIRVGSAARRWWSATRSVFRAEHDAYDSDTFELRCEGEGGLPPMPQSMKMSASIGDGTLTLYDGERVYAFLAKDPSTSAAAAGAYAAD